MNVADVMERVKRAFGDESGVQITDSDIFRWINDGQREIVLMNEGTLEKTTTMDLVEGDDEYSLPSDFLMPRSVAIKNSTDQGYFHIKYYSPQEFDQYVNGWDGESYGTGKPTVATIYESTLFLYPRPDNDSVEGIKLRYSSVPIDVTEQSDELSVPLIYHNAIVSYCSMKANEMDEDYDASSNHLAHMQNALTVASERQKYGTREAYPTITVKPEDR